MGLCSAQQQMCSAGHSSEIYGNLIRKVSQKAAHFDGDFLHCTEYCTVILQEGRASCEMDGATYISTPKREVCVQNYSQE